MSAAKPEHQTRIQLLEEVEQKIAKALDFAGQALNELSKDKPSNKLAESNTTQFLKSLEFIESELLSQINYLTTVSTGQPHEGSCYAAQKDLQMAQHRHEHVKSRLGELDRMRMTHLLEQQQLGFDIQSTTPAANASGAQRVLSFTDVTPP